MKSVIYSMVRSAPAILFLAIQPWLLAQNNVLSVTPPKKISGERNGTLAVKLRVQLRSGYHVNSNTPSEDYLIPIRLTWDASALEAAGIEYPKPSMESFQFSRKPLSVFTGDFDIVTKFKIPPKAPVGPAILTGKLRYQACNTSLCLPPKTIDVSIPVDVVK